MAKAKKNLLDDVLAKAAVRRPGFRSWFERLPTDAQAELEAVRQQWLTGQTCLGPKAMAEGIMAAAKDRGWQTSGVQGVIAWLHGKKR